MTDEGLLFEPDTAPLDPEWDGPGGAPGDDAALYLELDGWEGPLDLLLDLARRQKVDLRQISILALVDQYLVYIERAAALGFEIAADYLVMAAWLAYLKSALLLPGDEQEDPSPEELALRLQLDRLPGGTDEATMLRDAIQSFFANRAQSTRGRLRLLFRLAVIPIRVTYLGGGPPDAWRRDWPATGQAADSRK